MTSSERPTERPRASPRAWTAGGLPLPPWAMAALLLPPGWVFVLIQQRWHLTASAVMLMICWSTVVGIGYFAIRTALSAASADDDVWFTVPGRRDDLEREKRSLLKAIKEIEFDHDTGKLSDADAKALTASYRARAIEVLKAIEALDGAPKEMSVREQILAEARARAALDKKGKKSKKAKREEAAT